MAPFRQTLKRSITVCEAQARRNGCGDTTSTASPQPAAGGLSAASTAPRPVAKEQAVPLHATPGGGAAGSTAVKAEPAHTGCHCASV